MNSYKSNNTLSSNNGEDGASDTERPHKKARFAWQIKGKYHLKNAKKQMNDPTHTQSESLKPPSEDSSSKSTVELVANNTLDAHISSSLISPPVSPVKTNESQEGSIQCFPSVVLSREGRGQLSTYITSLRRAHKFSINETYQKREVYSRFCGMMMYRDKMRYEENCISEWQRDQIDKSKMENYINTILEIKRNITFVETNQSIIQCIEGVCENNVVDSGIGMAIAAYGLQPAENIPEERDEINEPNEINQFAPDEITSTHGYNKDTEPIPSKILDGARKSSSDNTNLAESSYENSTTIPSQIPAIHNPSTETNITEEFDENTESIPSVLLDEIETNSATGSDNDLNERRCSSGDNTLAIAFPEPNLSTDDYTADFMNTAVLHAIQSKGLVTTWTGFG